MENRNSTVINPIINPMVSADWLRLHLDDPQVVVIDCRFSLMEPESGRHQYEVGHIPGAYYLDLNEDLASPVQRHGGRHPLPDLEEFSEKLRSMGISQDTWVVLYDSARLSYAARAWWLLRYLGHDRTLLINGGWQAWTSQHYPTTTQQPETKIGIHRGQFQPNPKPNWIVDIEAVKTAIEKAQRHPDQVVLVDSRETVRYRGDREPIDPIAGHLPGAVNYPWQKVTDERGFINPEDQQCDRWQSIQDVPEIIVYCGSGVTACVNLLSLHIAGITGKLYVGSWSDWCSYQIAP
jgi:thiosulfate/3-mercaptopyruvate sulfurtransferase